METNQEFISKMLNVFRNKFEFVLKVYKDKSANFEVIGVNRSSKKKEHIYPVLSSGSYKEYVDTYIYPYLLETTSTIKSKFLFDNIYRFLDGDYEYSFDADFILNKERLNKKFSFYQDGKNAFLMLVEDNTRYKVEQFLDTLKSIKNCSLLYEVKKDKLGYHINYVSEQFANLVCKDQSSVIKALSKKHPFDFINKEDVSRITEIIFGNEKNGFHTSFVFKMNVCEELNVKVDVTYMLLGKKLYCYIIFEDITDILKLDKLSVELNETKVKNKNLEKENLTDALTGLGNETKYKLVTKDLEVKIQNGFKDFAVCVCDVNGVKVTNDKYGHQFGCHMIVTAGHTFPDYFKTSEIFHIGGDEYVIIVTGKDYQNLDCILKRIRNILDYQYMEFQGVKLRLSVAIGCSKFKDGDKCYHDPFQRADDDMYRRKIEIKTNHGIPLR